MIYRLPFIFVVLVYFAHVAGFATVKNLFCEVIVIFKPDSFCPV